MEEEPSECGEDEKGRGGALERRGALVPPRSGLAKYCKQDKRSHGATCETGLLKRKELKSLMCTFTLFILFYGSAL